MQKVIKLKLKPENSVSKFRREKHFVTQYTLVAPIMETVDGRLGIAEIAELRVYSTQAVTTACLWIHSRSTGTYTSGGARATGYGYDRVSSAAGGAFRHAGIELAECPDGRGSVAIEGALLALGAHLGYEGCTVLRAHA